MRLGGPIFSSADNPERWAEAHKKSGYAAAYCPGPLIRSPEDAKLAEAFVAAAKAADIVIAEVGAWSNPMAPDENARKKAIALCEQRLALADRIGARCCVNIAGSRGAKWDGPHPANLTQETFDIIVQTTRRIIDAVKPTRTFYTLEMMPWCWPDSPDSYLALIKAIDRPAFAVHLDPVNIVNCPARYFDTGRLVRECFEKLGPYIRSCHAKDIVLSERLTTHLDECRPGTGGLDYTAYLRELAKLDRDTPLMLEHLPNEQEYAQAAHHIRSVAAKAGVSFYQPRA